MTVVYPKAVGKFLRGQIDVETDTLRAELCDGYVYDPAHEWLADITDRFATPEDITVTGVSANGEVLVDPIVWSALAAGSTITGLVVYKWTGDEATSPAICALARRADTVPLAIATNDGAVSFTFPRLFKL